MSSLPGINGDIKFFGFELISLIILFLGIEKFIGFIFEVSLRSSLLKYKLLFEYFSSMMMSSSPSIKIYLFLLLTTSSKKYADLLIEPYII